MRIGMLADVYKPHTSGITNYISLNKQYLETQGHEVFVFVFGDEDYKDTETNIIRSSGVSIPGTDYYLSLRYSKQARRLLKSMDLVHIHHPFVTGQLAERYCRPRGVPMVFTNHTRYDLYAQAYLPGMPNLVGETALQAYLPSFCRSMDLVIAPSPGMREVLLKFGVEVPVDVVPNGVDLKRFKQSIEPIDRAELDVDAEDTILIYTGRLGPEKNIPFLLRSFGGVLQAYDHVTLLMVGGGPEEDNLQDRVKHMGIESKVRFTGMVPYDQMPRYLALADAFVTASVTEVHPLSVIEAMAAGLSVLGIESPGVGDTIKDGDTGYIIPEEDLAGFTAKMVRMVVDHDCRREMGENARRASEAYAIERTTQLMLERYQKVVEKGSRRKRGFRARWIRWVDNFRR